MRSLQTLFWFLAALAQARAFFGNFRDKTVYQYLADNGYTEFVKLVDEVGLTTTLSGQGPYTVLAPTNRALQRISPSLATMMSQSALAKKNVVKYHVIANFVLVPQVPHHHTFNTLAGQKLDVRHDGMSWLLNNVSHVDTLFNHDIICKNGVIQPIDKVLEPPLSSADNIAAVLVEKDDLFQEFFLAILLTNQTHLIESSEYTLFAPTNNAFGEAYKGIIGSHIPLPDRIRIFTEMVKYHLVPGARSSDMLSNGQKLYTLHGTSMNVSINAQGAVMVNYAHVTTADIPTSNGVIHAIDHLLFPMDMLAELRQLYAQYDKTTVAPTTTSG